jgi:hypothetical protein
MKREYPEILNCYTEAHTATFLPNCYLYGELIEKVNILRWFAHIKHICNIWFQKIY